MVRILSDILLMISLFIFPSYISAIILIACIFLFDNFMEAIVFGFIIDLLYGGGNIFYMSFHYFFTILISLVYLVSFRLKVMMRLSF